MSEATFKPGLEGVVAGETKLGEVTQKGLRYCGYDIADLAENTCFEEVAHLLLYGELPNKKELADFRKRVQAAMTLPEPVTRAINDMPNETPAMDVLRSAASLLGHYDPDAQDNAHDACVRKSERLIGQLAAAVGQWAQKTTGAPKVSPDADAPHGANLLAMMLGKRQSAPAGRICDGTMILYAEHEFNASTFTARTIASTLADMHSAVAGAIGALKGPLHGGANEAAMAQFLEIGSPENAETWFNDVLAHNAAHPDQKRLIMGFGHRVYKEGDHRAGILRGWAEKLSKETGETKWLEMADRLEALMREKKNIFPNMDYPAAHCYYAMGIPIPLYTPIFVCARVTGWCAHVMEQYAHNRLIRPRSEYTGAAPRKVPPIDQR